MRLDGAASVPSCLFNMSNDEERTRRNQPSLRVPTTREVPLPTQDTALRIHPTSDAQNVFSMLPPSAVDSASSCDALPHSCDAIQYAPPPPQALCGGAAERRFPVPLGVTRAKQHRGLLLDSTGRLAAENDEGAVEYKWRLTNISATRFEHLKTQMQFRVAEGQGQCLYELGVADDGMPRGLNAADYEESVDTVRRMAASLGFDIRVVFVRVVQEEPELLRCVELMVTKQLSVCDQTDLRIAFCGETDTGKSTLVSVLVHGTLDDGSGVARQGIFNHKHEVTSGQTSSVSRRVLGFDETGRVTNYDVLEERSAGGVADVYGGAQLCAAMNTTRTIAERSVKLVTLMDLGGAGRYRKTALLSITSRTPGYACICIRIDCVVHDAEQYLMLCRALRIPCFVVLTKADTVSELELDDALFELQDLLESRFDLKTLRVESDDDVQLAISALASSAATSPVRPHDDDDELHDTTTSGEPFHPKPNATRSNSATPTTFSLRPDQRVVPVFVISSVEGTGVEELKQLLHGLPIPSTSILPSCLPSANSLCSSMTSTSAPPKHHAEPHPTLSPTHGGVSGAVEVLLDGALKVPRVGTVVCGFVAKGVVRLHDTLMIGPDRKGRFHAVGVEGIHVKGSHVTYATAGLEVTIAIRHLSSEALLSGTSSLMLNLSRKGNVLVDQASSPNVCVEFEMEVVQVLTHGPAQAAASEAFDATTVRAITSQQEPIVHTRNIRQAARILSCAPRESVPYESSVGAVLHCKFLYNAEVLDVGATVLLRWNRDAKLMGVITTVHPITPTTSPALRPEAFPPLLLDEDEDEVACAVG